VGAAHEALGHSEEALTLLDEALALAEAGGEKQSLSAIHRLRGEALFGIGRHEEARHAIDQAAEIARRQGAKMEELRAATAAVRHVAECELADARAALLRVYSRFEEGHGMPDLRAASELLGANQDVSVL
jgi:tetratricopeptide (TPR) repeat protein